jgi:hypothetical protein
MGLGNPLISTGEDGLAVGGIATALFVPLLAAIIAVGLTIACFFGAAELKRRISR